MALGMGEYYPYVFFKINIDLIDTKLNWFGLRWRAQAILWSKTARTQIPQIRVVFIPCSFSHVVCVCVN
jgi:hypothetical protein